MSNEPACVNTEVTSECISLCVRACSCLRDFVMLCLVCTCMCARVFCNCSCVFVGMFVCVLICWRDFVDVRGCAC
jgi:hypothetical protein